MCCPPARAPMPLLGLASPQAVCFGVLVAGLSFCPCICGATEQTCGQMFLRESRRIRVRHSDAFDFFPLLASFQEFRAKVGSPCQGGRRGVIASFVLARLAGWTDFRPNLCNEAPLRVLRAHFGKNFRTDARSKNPGPMGGRGATFGFTRDPRGLQTTLLRTPANLARSG